MRSLCPMKAGLPDRMPGISSQCSPMLSFSCDDEICSADRISAHTDKQMMHCFELKNSNV